MNVRNRRHSCKVYGDSGNFGSHELERWIVYLIMSAENFSATIWVTGTCIWVHGWESESHQDHLRFVKSLPSRLSREHKDCIHSAGMLAAAQTCCSHDHAADSSSLQNKCQSWWDQFQAVMGFPSSNNCMMTVDTIYNAAKTLPDLWCILYTMCWPCRNWFPDEISM